MKRQEYKIIEKQSGIEMFSGSEQEVIKHWNHYYDETVGIFSHYITNENDDHIRFSYNRQNLELAW